MPQILRGLNRVVEGTDAFNHSVLLWIIGGKASRKMGRKIFFGKILVFKRVDNSIFLRGTILNIEFYFESSKKIEDNFIN